MIIIIGVNPVNQGSSYVFFPLFYILHDNGNKECVHIRKPFQTHEEAKAEAERGAKEYENLL
ncbi:MAG: hypothetical protein HPY53_01730, partial [Brevinematales bacterium]|nr:hypothetical protein [Brevinematales bacterium]